MLGIAGVCWAADAMEIMLLSFLSPTLQDEWQLTDAETASLTTAVFAGMLVGAGAFGVLADVFGRRIGYLTVVTFTLISAVASALAPSYIWMLLFRCCVGIGVGGTHVAFTLFAEFLPTSQRSTCLLWIELFWAVGSFSEAVLAWAVLPSLGWRWLLILTSLPLFLMLLCYPILPESPRWLSAVGRDDDAMQTLQLMAKINKKELANKSLVPVDTKDEKAGVADLLMPTMRKTTILLWLIWFVDAFCYYGFVLLTTEVFSKEDQGERCATGDPITDASVGEDSSLHEGVSLSTSDFVDVAVTALAEIPGLLLTLWIMNKYGRKKAQSLMMLGAAACTLLLIPCTPRWLETVFLFGMRGCIAGTFQATYVYTPEVYPTKLRSSGLGICSSIARIGGMSTPYVAEVLSDTSLDASIAVYATLGLVAVVAAQALPIETADRPLSDQFEGGTATADFRNSDETVYGDEKSVEQEVEMVSIKI